MFEIPNKYFGLLASDRMLAFVKEIILYEKGL
jgi:hypothetical protein